MAKYLAMMNSKALDGFKMIGEYEGIIPALVTSHAIHYATKLTKTLHL